MLTAGTPARRLLVGPAAGTAEEAGLPDLLASALAGAGYGRFEEAACLLLARMGYREVAPLGRAAYSGRSPSPGADVAARMPQGGGRVLVRLRQYDGPSVRSRMVDELRGACLREQAEQGVLIATSRFGREALRAARRGGHPRAVCIDGATLAELCIAHRVGVRQERVSALVLDREFFASNP